MKLSMASRYFDRTTGSDAYDQRSTFKCQIEPFDYVKIDGASVKRRVMSTAPGVSLPARKVIDIHGQRYLVGDASEDHWNDASIRKRYVLQGADHSVTVLTIADILAGRPGLPCYATLDFNKYGTDERDNSDYHQQYHAFFGGGESVPEGSVIKLKDRYFLVRSSYVSLAGLVDALSNELDGPVEDTATFTSRTHDPLTDSFSETSTSVRCMRVRWQERFQYLTLNSPDYERNDVQAFIDNGYAVKAGDEVALSDGMWRVLAVTVRPSYTEAHLRLK